MFDITAFQWPQWLELFLMAAGLLIAANQHGKPRDGKHNFFISVIGILIVLLILTKGGFFNPTCGG